MILKRQVFKDIIKDRLLHLDFGWFFRRGGTYVGLRLERYLRTGRAPAPLMAICIVTENCNLRCPMCDLPARYRSDPRQLDTAKWKRIIDELHALGTAGIGFTGGEPTVRSDIFELVGHARGHRIPVTLNTNGLLLNEERIRELIAAGPTNVNISIDSGRDEINDQLRGGKNVLSRTLERLQALVKAREAAGARFRVTVVTVLSDLNLNDLDILFEKVKAAGVDRIGFMPLHEIRAGRCSVASFKAVPADVGGMIRGLSAKHGLPLENSDAYVGHLGAAMGGQGEMPMACNAGYTSIVIGPDLKMYRCWPYYEKGQAFGKWDMEARRLKAIWNDGPYREERLKARQCRECFWNCHAELNYLVSMGD